MIEKLIIHHMKLNFEVRSCFLKILQMEVFHTGAVDKYTVRIYHWKYFRALDFVFAVKWTFR